VVQAREHLPHKCRALNLNPSTTKNKQTKKMQGIFFLNLRAHPRRKQSKGLLQWQLPKREQRKSSFNFFLTWLAPENV
jgi:hypothetical protein